MSNYSPSLRVVWLAADFEARQIHAGLLEPAHLLLGWCKCVDIDVLASVAAGTPDREHLVEELLREFRRLREVFHRSGLDACRFRRHYRTVLPQGAGGVTPAEAGLHRNDAARDVFRQAEQLAVISGGEVCPVHLLLALLLEDDSGWREALAAAGTTVERLRSAVRQCVFGSAGAGVAPRADCPGRWN